MIYFTSDLHFNHRGALNMCGRPFESIEEMNDTLLKNWNSVVHKDDTVYILGDISHRTPIETINEFIRKLNGKKILIKGNHDKNYDESLFEEIAYFKEINFNGISISLMHYPMVEWPKSRHGSVHLHGHQHNKSDYNERMRKEGIKRYDVGVDANDFKPVSINEILNFIYKNNEPLYKVNDEITFKYKGKKTEGIVYIVDKYHFGYYDPTYDILLKDENKQLLLMKHVLEKYIKLFEGNNTQFERDLYFIKEEFNKLTKEPSL